MGLEARALLAVERHGFSAVIGKWLQGSDFSTLAPPTWGMTLPMRAQCCVSESKPEDLTFSQNPHLHI